MQINRLRLVNFRQHEHTELELGAGLTGIVGPNGAGKTTILEAIAWAMYGMPAARGSRDTIRRRGAPPRARVEVELEFTLGPHQYRVLRSLHDVELYQDGDTAPIARSLGTVSDRITRILGMNRDEFFNTYFTGQKELAVMAAMSAPERAQFLSRVLGYERIRAAQDRLKERRSALRAKVEALRAGLADPAELDAAEAQAGARVAAAAKAESASAKLLKAAERTLEKVRPQREQLQQLRETALGLEAEIRVAEHQVAAAGERTGRLDQDLTAAKEAGRQLKELEKRLAQLPVLCAEVKELERQAEAHSHRQGLLARLSDLRAHVASVHERQERIPAGDTVESARIRVSDLRATLTTVTLDSETARTTWVRDAQDAKTKRQGLLDQYQELKEQRQRLVKAGPEGDCPTCHRPLGAEYQKVLDLLDRQLEEVVSNGNYYKQRIEQLQQEPSDLEEIDRRRIALEGELSGATTELGRLEAQLQEGASLAAEQDGLVLRTGEVEAALAQLVGSYDEKRHRAVVNQIKALEPLSLQAERLRVLTDRREALVEERAGAGDELKRAETVAAGLRKRLAGLKYSESAHQAARDAEQRAEQARREAEIAQARARAESGAAAEAVQAVARRRAERALREQEADAAARDLALHQELDRALTDLRTELNAALRPDLSELASAFLRDLTNGRYTELELDEDYGATLLDEGDPKAVISGGEEDIANLALRLAISQMIAERAGQPLSLLILDEIFGSLDEDRRTSVVELLRSLADRFPQVILITHIDSVREGFDRVVRVGFDLASGVATVRDEPLGDHGVAA